MHIPGKAGLLISIPVGRLWLSTIGPFIVQFVRCWCDDLPGFMLRLGWICYLLTEVLNMTISFESVDRSLGSVWNRHWTRHKGNAITSQEKLWTRHAALRPANNIGIHKRHCVGRACCRHAVFVGVLLIRFFGFFIVLGLSKITTREEGHWEGGSSPSRMYNIYMLSRFCN